MTLLDTVTKKKEKQDWNTFDLGFTSFRIGGGFLVDYSGYWQDEDGKAQMDSANLDLKSGFKVRDSRLAISGKFKTKRTITWRAGFMWDGQLDSWFLRETGLMIYVPELWGQFFIGRTKEGISLNKIKNGYSGELMERYMASDPIPILADGIKWMGYLPKTGIFWNIGAFTDIFSKGQSFSTYSSQVAARIGWLPIQTATENLHIAVNIRMGRPVEDSIRIRAKPEASNGPYFLDAGKFQSDKASYSGFEIYYNKGPWTIGSEYFWDRFHSVQKQDPVFKGGEIHASYAITGEIRPYNTVGSIYGFMPVRKSVFHGGPGAWDVVLRYSVLDLNDGLVQGGKFWRLTPGVNWYLSENVRFELNYGYGVLDRFNKKGATQFFQSRIQLTL